MAEKPQLSAVYVICALKFNRFGQQPAAAR
jgi:hypothetical protein